MKDNSYILWMSLGSALFGAVTCVLDGLTRIDGMTLMSRAMHWEVWWGWPFLYFMILVAICAGVLRSRKKQ